MLPPRDTLSRALHASIHGDRDTLEAVFTPDVKTWTPAHSASSVAELLAEFETRDEAFSDIELNVTPLDVGGDYACAKWQVSMTHTGNLELRDRRLSNPPDYGSPSTARPLPSSTAS